MTGPTLSSRPHHVTITSGPAGTELRIDDTDVTGAVRGYSLEQQAGQPAHLALYAAPGSAAFDGYAHVVIATHDPAAAIVDFLAGVDATALDEAALNRTDYGGGPGATARAMLDTLTEWARTAGGAP